MASTPNENSNIMDEFEEAFKECLLSLTKPEPSTAVNKEEIELEVKKTTNRFISVARQMEAHFLQKRFLVATMKPEVVLKDENLDIRYEIQRKEALLNKHYNRLEEWKLCLSDKLANNRLMSDGGGRPGGMPALPAGAICHVPVAAGGSGQQQQQQQQMQQQKMMQAQQLQQMRMMGKMNKQ